MSHLKINACQDIDLMFLPGASGKTDFWHAVMSQLHGYRSKSVIAYPSFAGEPSHPDVCDFNGLQRYVIDQVSNNSVIIAQSMGGIFAVQAALQKPQQVQALVLVATSGGIDLTPFKAQDWREQYQQQFDLPDWFAVTKTQGVADALQHIQCPVLLIWGDDDPISPVAVGQHLKERLQQPALQQRKQVELYVIAGGQHNLAHVHADQVSALISDFLQCI